ncbi:hypothetical protein Mgra_00009238 [Meloidogyne graminicola]|uniref:Uncharacterized protein n=1 Tax=Meloidogyne graminicola TaxID=189291 RepID=A0A8S9ZDI7_9BILA|nr:hypothetical protein Mgra_00009238 [Meloidogyne graminicola]
MATILINYFLYNPKSLFSVLMQRSKIGFSSHPFQIPFKISSIPLPLSDTLQNSNSSLQQQQMASRSLLNSQQSIPKINNNSTPKKKKRNFNDGTKS